VKRWLFRLLLLSALAALGCWGWRALFPDPEQVVRKRLAELAQAASIAPNESPLARLANSQKLIGFFTRDVEVAVDVPGQSLQTFSGRDALSEAVTGARSCLQSLKIQFLDVHVALGEDRQTAIVNLTAIARMPGEKDPVPQEMKLSLKKIDGDWLVQKVETVKTLL
jgi:hypothetical protein